MGTLFLIIISLYFLVTYGIFQMAKKRGIENPWLAFIPITSSFIIGKILDNINSYRDKQTNFKMILLVLTLIPSIVSGLGITTSAITTIVSVLTYALRFITLLIVFAIFRDYDPKHARLFFILSIFLYLDFIFLYIMRDKVPISMCFRLEDEHKFEANQPKLQLLWDEYHSQPQMQSWTEFLTQNFVPIS